MRAVLGYAKLTIRSYSEAFMECSFGGMMPTTIRAEADTLETVKQIVGRNTLGMAFTADDTVPIGLVWFAGGARDGFLVINEQ